MSRLLKRVLSLCLLGCLCLSFAVFAAPQAVADGAVAINRVLIQTGPTGKTPIASQAASDIPVGTTTGGCYIAASGWYDSSGNYVSGSFSTTTVHLEVQISAQGGFGES